MSTSGSVKSTIFHAALACGILLGTGCPAFAEKPGQVRETLEQSIEMRQQTQRREDDWSITKQELQSRYQFLQEEEKRRQQGLHSLRERLAMEQKIVVETERGITGAQEYEQQLQPFLENTVTALETFISRDLPFLQKERADRLRSLRETLARPDASGAEKTRRVMEALHIETDYGRSVEVYQETRPLDGQPLLLDILRLGRISLFCRTPDGGRVGHYDREAGEFVSLPAEDHPEVIKAMEIARRERTADLVKLPIGRIIVQ